MIVFNITYQSGIRPQNQKMSKHKLGVIVPLRGRDHQKNVFLRHTLQYLSMRNYDYEIIIVEQDDAKQFNRGMLLNIGYIYAKKLKCDYIVFHDVDMLPVRVDYTYSKHPIHLATNFILDRWEKKRETFEEYFGGVTMFPIETFEKINGYSNKYWGWGYEDTELLYRCKINDVDLDTLKLKNMGRKGTSLRFNGIDSYIECENIIDFNKSATFLITFNLEKFILDHTKKSDEFTAFSIPGWDFAVCYSSFSRYNFCAFDSDHKPYYINTDIKPPYKTTIAIVMDRLEKKFMMYQDGVFVGETDNFKRLYPYKKENNFYLGVGKLDRLDSPNYFNGTISSFAYYDDVMDEETIYEISTTDKMLTDVGPTNSLMLYYDTNHIDEYHLTDLTGNGINGKIVNCEIVKEEYDSSLEVKIPHRRRSIFKSLKHEENGFLGDGWKDQATRWNQLRFHNEVYLNPHFTKEDGLSNLEFVEWGVKKENNVLYVNVGI